MGDSRVVRTSNRRWVALIAVLLGGLLFAELAARAGIRKACFSSLRFVTADFNRICVAEDAARAELQFPSNVFPYDAQRGYKLGANVREDTWTGGCTTDANGFRRVRAAQMAKTPGVQRLLAIGDSQTFGQGVTDAETWPAQLEALVPGREVLNLGVPCYGQDQALLALQADGARFRPDVVLFGFYDNDLDRNMVDVFCYEKPQFVPGSAGQFQLRHVPVPRPEEVAEASRWQSRARALVRAALQQAGAIDPPVVDPDALVQVAEYILGQMQETVAQLGARLVVVQLPTRDELAAVAEQAPSGDPRTWRLTQAQRLCAERGIAYVDTTPALAVQVRALGMAAFEQRYMTPITRSPGHFSAVGNRLVAEVVHQALAATATVAP